jgi:uncharacterized protein YbcV (DUF1398 family)
MDPSIAEELSELWNIVISAPTILFKDVLPTLVRLAVQRYHVDFVARTITIYVANHAYVTKVAFPPFAPGPEAKWDTKGMVLAVKMIEAEEISYEEFARMVVGYGVTNYWVFMEGPKALYLGAKGEVYDFSEVGSE